MCLFYNMSYFQHLELFSCLCASVLFFHSAILSFCLCWPFLSCDMTCCNLQNTQKLVKEGKRIASVWMTFSIIVTVTFLTKNEGILSQWTNSGGLSNTRFPSQFIPCFIGLIFQQIHNPSSNCCIQTSEIHSHGICNLLKRTQMWNQTDITSEEEFCSDVLVG